MDAHATNALRVILTGATGMIGEGVLQECLKHPMVEQVLAISRRSCGISHPKLKEIIHADFYDLSSIEDQLTGYNSCLFCLGVSSVGMREAVYYRLTHTLTMQVAETLCRSNPGMVFCYISGVGTDASEKGKIMWARVKGKTENDLMKLPFKGVYNFRPGVLQPMKGAKNTLRSYQLIGWVLLPVIRLIAPKNICTLREFGLAMINICLKGYPQQVITVKDILFLSKIDS